jgi:hypothetical protein
MSAERGNLLRYMITFNHIEGAWDGLSSQDRERHSGWLTDFMETLAREKESKLVFFANTKTVRMGTDGDIRVSDGPYHTGDEQPGGYYIIDAESMDEAIEWARKGRFMIGSNECREIADL